MAFLKKHPNTPQLIASPSPTVSIIKGNGSERPYPYLSTKGTIMALLTTGGIKGVILPLRRILVPRAPSAVAILPKTMSIKQHPVKRLLKRQPINKPGMAAGVKTGRMVRDSERRI